MRALKLSASLELRNFLRMLHVHRICNKIQCYFNRIQLLIMVGYHDH